MKILAISGARAALLIKGALDRLAIHHDAPVGAIHRFRIDRLGPQGRWAQGDIGGAEGFAPLRGDEALAPGALVYAQILRPAMEGKAARLSLNPALSSRLAVYTPLAPGVNISRKITDEAARAALADAFTGLEAQGGFIIRSAAADHPELAARMAQRLAARWRAALEGAPQGPGLVLAAPDPIARALYDWPLEGAHILIHEAPDLLEAARLNGLDARMAADDPFETLDIDARITALLTPEELLPGGGAIYIEPTRAFIAVDVDSGADARAAAMLRANLAAANALPRALDLRALGGKIAVDFAGAPEAQDRARIEKALRKACAARGEDLRAHGWGPEGVYVLTKPRRGPSLAQLLEAK